jgi:hypothetical protein
MAAGGATDAWCGERERGGGRRGGMEQITAHSNPYSSFSLSFFPLCIRQGFVEKLPHVAVQHNTHLYENIHSILKIIHKYIPAFFYENMHIFHTCINTLYAYAYAYVHV